jgi:glycosyltransferase involved in cell wall biosynthesis
MPRILLNAANLKVGGLKQVALNFILQNLQQPAEFDWHYTISTELAQELQRSGVATLPQSTTYAKSSARDKSTQRELVALANRLEPAIVFTFGGPAYFKFRQPHLLGMYEPWVSHAGKDAYRILSFPGEWLKFKALAYYKRWWARRADWWITETEIARQGLHRHLGAPLERIAIVSNAAGAAYTTFRERRGTYPVQLTPDRPLRLLCFCAAYKHKNLGILPHIAAALRKRRPDFPFRILLTLPQDGSDWQQLKQTSEQLGVSQNFENRGPILAADGPELYQQADCLLLPTVLETFSATYPEAMNMGLPIITPGLDYLEDICRDAALYYSAYDPQQAAERILELSGNESLWNQLIDAGKRRLPDFPEPPEKQLQYHQVLRTMLRELSIA